MRTFGFVATAVLALLVTAVPPANGQARQRGGDGERQRTERRAQPRAERTEPQRQPRAERAEPQRTQPQRAERAEPQRQPRTERESTRSAPQAFVQQNDGGRRVDNNRNDGRHVAGERYAVPRPVVPAPRYRNSGHREYVQPYRNYYVYRYPAYRYYGGRRYYSYSYYDPYYSGNFYWSNYAWQPRSYYVGPSWDYALGKLRLDIDQRDADVYIDGYFAGQVDDFDGVLQGLRLEPGHYAVEIVLPGFAPLQFDVQIAPGRTTTYRGYLLPE